MADNSHTSKSYGFIGLGVMGWGMAHNLRRKLPESAEFHVCEVVQDRRDKWVAEYSGNVHVANTPREISMKCDVIITMLPKGQHVRQVFTSPESGLLSAPISDVAEKPPKVFIDCSTIDVATSLEVGKAVMDSGLGIFADAPVSGGEGGARQGTLTFMVGGPQETFDVIKPTLEHMGKLENIFHCGKLGAGLSTKLINNYMSAVNMIGVCEGMNLGRLCGLDPGVLAGVVNTSTGMSRNSREQNPVKGVSPSASAAKDFEGGFSTELCVGVLEMALDLGNQLGARTVLEPVVRSLYGEALQSDKCKGKDFRSIYKLFSDDD